MPLPRPAPEPVAQAAPVEPEPPARADAALRRVEEPPALVMVLAPVIGLAMWAGLIALAL